MEVVVKENPILPYEFTFIILSHGKLTGTKLLCEYNKNPKKKGTNVKQKY